MRYIQTAVVSTLHSLMGIGNTCGVLINHPPELSVHASKQVMTNLLRLIITFLERHPNLKSTSFSLHGNLFDALRKLPPPTVVKGIFQNHSSLTAGFRILSTDA